LFSFSSGVLLGEKASSFNPPSPPPLRRGLIQVFTGDGKGKTSAAIGTVIRALGHGLKVYIALFMKGDYLFGERQVLSELSGVTLKSFGSSRFVDPDNIRPEEKTEAARALASARQAMLSGEYDLVVLDEVNLAVAFNLLGLDEVLGLIEAKPEDVGLVLTGRQADKELVRAADLVTECLKIKHPYDSGVEGGEGFEY
jgi:cob(I)alamin adenosyltransferase